MKLLKRVIRDVLFTVELPMIFMSARMVERFVLWCCGNTDNCAGCCYWTCPYQYPERCKSAGRKCGRCGRFNCPKWVDTSDCIEDEDMV